MPAAPVASAPAKPPRARRRLRLLGFAACALLVVPPLAVGFGACAFSAPRHVGSVTDHFDGERFHNARERRMGFDDFLRWQWERTAPTPPAYAEHPYGPPPPAQAAPGAVRITWIQHATVLVQADGVNVLTDPIWSHRCSPVGFAGPERIRNPGIRFEDLPPIHAVVVSHNHYDHLDLPTLARLRDAFHPAFHVPLGNAKLLAEAGIEPAFDHDWWQGVPLSSRVRLTAVPAQHFSGRGAGDRDATLWAGWVIEAPAGTVYFAGDTGLGPHFAQIGARFGRIDVALLPIGAYKPEWFMGHVHTSPADAVQALFDLGAAHAVGIHWGTFPLADDALDEPPRELRRAAALAGLDPERFTTPPMGEGRDYRR